MKKPFSKWIDKDLLSVQCGDQNLSILALALPIFLESIGCHFIDLIQTALSAHFMDSFFVYAFAIPNSALGPLQSLSGLITTGLGIILSITLGMDKKKDAASITGTAYLLYIGINVLIFGAALALAKPYLNMMGLAGEKYAAYTDYALLYFRTKCVNRMLISAGGTVFTVALRCFGFPKYSLFSSLITSGLTAGLTYIAYYVAVISKDSVVWVLQAIELVVNFAAFGYVFVAFRRRGLSLRLRPEGHWAKVILKLGLPAGAAALSYSISEAVTSVICSYLDPNVLVAKSYISQIVYFDYIMGYAIGQANALMVGRICGMGQMDTAARMHRQNLRITLALNTGLAVLLALFARPLFTALFNANGQILSYASVILWIDVAVEIGRGMNHLGQFGLNAAGDVNFTTAVSVTSCWVCSVGLSALFVYVFGWDLYGIWVAFAVDELFRGTLYYVRWRRNSWQTHFLKEKKVLAGEAT